MTDREREEWLVGTRIEAIEKRLAKIPDNLDNAVIRGRGLKALVEDLRFAVKELKSARATEKARRAAGGSMESLLNRLGL